MAFHGVIVSRLDRSTGLSFIRDQDSGKRLLFYVKSLVRGGQLDIREGVAVDWDEDPLRHGARWATNISISSVNINFGVISRYDRHAMSGVIQPDDLSRSFNFSFSDVFLRCPNPQEFENQRVAYESGLELNIRFVRSYEYEGRITGLGMVPTESPMDFQTESPMDFRRMIRACRIRPLSGGPDVFSGVSLKNFISRERLLMRGKLFSSSMSEIVSLPRRNDTLTAYSELGPTAGRSICT